MHDFMTDNWLQRSAGTVNPHNAIDCYYFKIELI